MSGRNFHKGDHPWQIVQRSFPPGTILRHATRHEIRMEMGTRCGKQFWMMQSAPKWGKGLMDAEVILRDYRKVETA